VELHHLDGRGRTALGRVRADDPRGIIRPRVSVNPRVGASRDGHSGGGHALLPADTLSTSVQSGARGEIVESSSIPLPEMQQIRLPFFSLDR